MQDVPASEIEAWSRQIWLGAGVFFGGLIWTIRNLIKSARKKTEDDSLLTRGESAELVRLAKDNEDLRAALAEDKLRREFDLKIVDVRQDFAEVMQASREQMHNRINEISSEISEIKGMLNARLPGGGRR